MICHQRAKVRRIKSFAFLMGGVAILCSILSYIPAEARAESYPRPEYQDAIPYEIRTILEEVGYDYQICPELLEAMAYNESRFDPTVTNKNCYGLLQVNVKVHAKRLEKYDFTEEDMFDPKCNAIVAADYLRELYETYSDENPIVLAIYSGNWEAVNEYKEYGHLCSYAEDILTRSAKYERLHGK